MKILGFVFVAIGLVDLIGSFMGFDLWGGFLGINLPDILWQYSAYIELAIGYGLIQFGSGGDDAEPEAGSESDSDAGSSES